MELKVFRDVLPAAGADCTAKAELPLETELLISDYLPPVQRIVKCFAKPVVLQKQLAPGRLTLEGYLRCTVYYQGEEGAGLCQIEQKLPFTKALELPSFAATAWTACVEGQTEYLNCRAVNPRRIEVRGAYGLVVSVHAQLSTEVITALSEGGIEQKPVTLAGVRRAATLEKLVTIEGALTFPKPLPPSSTSPAPRGAGAEADAGQGRGEGGLARPLRMAGRRGRRPPQPDRRPALQPDPGCRRPQRGLPLPLRAGAGGLCGGGRGDHRGRRGFHHPHGHGDAAAERLASLPAPMRGRCLLHPLRDDPHAPDSRHRIAALRAGRDDGAAGLRPSARRRSAYFSLLRVLRAGEPDAAGGESRPDGPGRGVGLCGNTLGEMECYEKALDYALPLPADLPEDADATPSAG